MYINRSIEQPIINAINTFKVVLITGPRHNGVDLWVKSFGVVTELTKSPN